MQFFDDQKRLTNSIIKGLLDRGWIVPRSTKHKSDRRVAPIRNRFMGDVISYVSFVNKAMKDELSQEDARHLLVIEMTRLNGKPRRKLITRLLNMSYADERAKVLTVLDRLNPEE